MPLRNPFRSKEPEYRESSFDADEARRRYAEVEGMSVGEWYRRVIGESSSQERQRKKDPSLEDNWSEGSQFGGSDRQNSVNSVGIEPQPHRQGLRDNDRRDLPSLPDAHERTEALRRAQQEAIRARRERNGQPRGNTDRILDRLIVEEQEHCGQERSGDGEILVSSPTALSESESSPLPYEEVVSQERER